MYLFGKYKGEKIWQEIAKEFEQKTAKYPTDVITIGNKKKIKRGYAYNALCARLRY